MCKRFIETLAGVLLLAVAATAAQADDGFKQHYEAGLAHYSSEEYDVAIKEFQAAYAVKAKARLLFNIGQSYRSLGNAREALRYYLLYQVMESNPKPGLKTELEGYIGQMKAIVEEAERARLAEEREAAAAAATTNLRSTAANPQPATAHPQPALAPTAMPELVAAAPPPAPRPLHKRAWFWGVIGGAAATVVVTGLAVGLSVNSGYGGDVRHPTF